MAGDNEIVTGPTFCGVPPQAIEMADRLAYSWARLRSLKYIWLDRINGLTAAKLPEDSRWAFAEISKAVNGYLTFTPTANRAEANIVLTTRQIDGLNGVLAETELPPGDDRQIRGWFDVGERWDVSVMFRLVFLHEMMHAQGVGHIPRTRAVAVMNPVYNPQLATLQAADIEALFAIYPEARNFKPTPPVTPPQQPPTTSGDQMIVSVVLPGQGGTWTGPLTRIL